MPTEVSQSHEVLEKWNIADYVYLKTHDRAECKHNNLNCKSHYNCYFSSKTPHKAVEQRRFINRHLYIFHKIFNLSS